MRDTRYTWQRQIGLASSLIVMALAGCTEAPLLNPSGNPTPALGTPFGCLGGTPDDPNLYGAIKRWDCGTTLLFTNLPSGLSGHLSDWNWRLKGSLNGAPILEEYVSGGYSSTRRRVNVNYTYASDGTYCGSFDPSSSPPVINLFDGACGALGAVFANELAGIVGYADGTDGYGDDSPYMYHCTRTIPEYGIGNVVNASVCQHEAEGILSVYGIRNGPHLGGFSGHIVTGLTAAGVSMTVGTTYVSPNAGMEPLQFDGGNMAEIVCGLALKTSSVASLSSGPCVPVSGDWATYQWTSLHPTIATISGTGPNPTITAHQAGSATMTLKVDDPGPFGLATYINGNGVETVQFTVTVNSPPVNQPDLEGVSGGLLDIYNNSYIAMGETYNATVYLKNSGSASAGGVKQHQVYLSTDATYSVGDVLIGTITDTATLANNNSIVSRTGTFSVPGTVSAGDYYAVIRIDGTNAVSEVSEGNNDYSTGEILKVRQCVYEPQGYIEAPIGSVTSFFPTGDCTGRSAKIAPTSGIAGFSSGTNCTLHQTTSLLKKVRGCSMGNVTLKIYKNSNYTDLEQETGIGVGVL